MHNCCPPGLCATRLDPHSLARLRALYIRCPAPQMKTNFSNLPLRDGLFSWHTNRGVRCGAATAYVIRAFSSLSYLYLFAIFPRVESSRVDRSNEPPHHARERSLLSRLLFIEKEKLTPPEKDTRSLVVSHDTRHLAQSDSVSRSIRARSISVASCAERL